jgi:L-malate glycosyltransferase
MACGCPVLGYRAGGLPEVVIDGECGILCDEGKDVCLGTIAVELLEDQQRYRKMRLAARKQAERFATKPMADQYEKEVLGLQGRAARGK